MLLLLFAEPYWKMHSQTVFSVHPSFYVLVALSLFCLPINWVIGWLLATGIHEFFHILTLWILKIPIRSMHLCMSGAVIATGRITTPKEILCALAGPVGGLLTLLLLKVTPEIALCASIQSFYNLLPIYPLDGGRAMKCIVTLIWGDELAEKISKTLSVAVIILLGFGGIFLSYHFQIGLLPLIFPAILLLSVTYKNPLQRR